MSNSLAILQDDSTEIIIGDGAISELAKIIEKNNFSISVCSDISIWPIVQDIILVDAPYIKEPNIWFLSGESNKTIEEVKKGWEYLLQSGADRDRTLINIGGGIVCDMGGFIAATYKRGIPFINIPTSLLSMVDASVGGKTAINIGAEKNIVGAFARAERVIIDTRFIRSLPLNEFQSGAAEMFKIQLLKDKDFSIEGIEAVFEPALFKTERLIKAIEWKIEVVKDDFREKGLRRILNLGHTYGHAFESLYITKNKDVTHGQAVAWGMIFELYISVIKRNFSKILFRQIRDLLVCYYGKPSYVENDIKFLLSCLLHDKKTKGYRVQPVLMIKAGVYDYEFSMSLDEAENILINGEAIYTF